ncbi:uncharacterized protein [Rutidosis leptorrhynchoides]|uniref:uncharacterized protein n=1 Tax=Rutidosis leptorrhynchoides TaxID=125765 RepID=UPI003A995495
MAEGISITCLNSFCKCILELYVNEYLRKPTSSDIARLYSANEEMHGANNDFNVLNQSSLFDDIKNGTAPFASFNVNGNEYTDGYYLADSIYLDWATLIKAYSTSTDEPREKFKQFQESARKDAERTFSIFQGRYHILQMAGRPHSVNKLRRILYFCVLLHNMIVEDNGYTITWLDEESLRTDEANPNFVVK